jgi:Ca2+:H+ antiporter
MSPRNKTNWPAALFPAIAVLFFGLTSVLGLGGAFTPSPLGIAAALLLVPILLGTVFAAVHHAEVIAHRTGEPYGTLVLTVAVTVIEVALIASIMLSEEGGSPTLARDTVFAVVMIVCNGLVGLCILIGGLRYREVGFRVTGVSAYLAVLLVLATMTLILPSYTRAAPGPVYSISQLVFVSAVTLALYGAFLYIQTVRHRDYFTVRTRDESEPDHDRDPPSNREVGTSLALLVLALTGVILLAKKFAAVVEISTTAAGVPHAVVGVIVALLILLPEGVAAVRAARRNQLQTSLNLALGSSLATIGLTIPAVAAVSIVIGRDLVLGLGAGETVLLALTLLVSVLTFGTGRTNILYGFVHLVVFATYLFLVFVP